MAEAILSAVSKLSVVGLDESVSNVVEKLSRKVNGLRELTGKFKMIEKELRMIDSVIQDLGTTHLSNIVIKGWIAGVRNMAYHVEDVVDKYSYEALKVQKKLKGKDFLHWYVLGGSRQIIVFSNIVDDVVEIEHEIRQVNEMQKYWTNLDYLIKNEREEIDRTWSGGHFQGPDEDLVGIDENRSKLTEWLTTDEKESTVITISGMGGVGKTTLVKNVYDWEKANFPGAAWIVVSQSYDILPPF